VKVIYYPEFPKHIKRFEAQYREVSEALAVRFRQAVDDAIQRIKASPGSAGHSVNTGSRVVKEVRRRNLASFPVAALAVGPEAAGVRVPESVQLAGRLLRAKLYCPQDLNCAYGLNWPCRPLRWPV